MTRHGSDEDWWLLPGFPSAGGRTNYRKKSVLVLDQTWIRQGLVAVRGGGAPGGRITAKMCRVPIYSIQSVEAAYDSQKNNVP